MAITGLSRLPEVAEEDAPAPIKAIYDDVRATLRVPMVNLIFRVLAGQPDYLHLAWRQLKPNAATVFFEESADVIRARAVDGVAGLATPPGAEPAAVANALRIFHYVNPKLLLAVAALRAATSGQYPQLEELPAGAKRQIAPGVPEGASAPATVDPSSASPAVAALFDDITSTLGLPVVNSDYRALAAWPSYLESAWTALKPLTQRAEYLALNRDLRAMADEAVMVFPFRIETNPHTLRHCGLSERDIDTVRFTLDQFYRLLPGLIVNVSFFAAGAFDRDAARTSPFPSKPA